MQDKRRSQSSRTAATREALIGASRLLFAKCGYSDVSTESIVEAAKVTRGALYHHFTDKNELFAAVFEAVETEMVESIKTAVAKSGPSDPLAAIRLAASTALDLCIEPEIQRIVLIDAPAVLGWVRWREIGDRHSLALARGLLAQAIETGRVRQQPVDPLTHVLLGAVRESSLYMVSATNRKQARKDIGAAMDWLIRSLDADDPDAIEPRPIAHRRKRSLKVPLTG